MSQPLDEQDQYNSDEMHGDHTGHQDGNIGLRVPATYLVDIYTKRPERSPVGADYINSNGFNFRESRERIIQNINENPIQMFYNFDKVPYFNFEVNYHINYANFGIRETV